MSGINQHYIPRFLQRGFGVRRRGKPKEIWEYRPGASAELREIKHVGAEEHFYSTPTDEQIATLDDKITAFETPLARQFNALRVLGIGSAVDPQIARDVIFHLVPRTKHTRSTFSDAFASIMQSAVTLFSDPGTIMRYAGLDQSALNDQFRTELMGRMLEDVRFKELGLPAPLFEKIVFQMAKEGFAAGQFPQLYPFLDELALMAGQVDGLMREGHNKLVGDIIDTGIKRPDIESWNWAIEAAPPGGTILPDSIAIAYDADGCAQPMLLAGKGRSHAIVMPISSDRLLIGRGDASWVVPIDRINADLAACGSLFLAACGTRFDNLTSVIGTRVSAVVTDLIETAIAPFSAKIAADDAASDRPSEPVSSADSLPQNLRYVVSFKDCADQETAERIAAQLNYLTMQFSRIMPLERLDGVTVAHDYPKALAELDRGRPDAPPVTTVSAEVGVGIARCVTVVRDDVIKTHLVLASNLAFGLISEDGATQLWAVHAIAYQLAQIAYQDILDSTLPGVLLQPVEGFGGSLFSAVDGALDAYFASREVNFIGDVEQTEADYGVLLTEAIVRMVEKFPAKRVAYRYHGDLDSLLSDALAYASYVLQFAAKLIGHAAGRDTQPWTQGDLAKALASAGLTHWVETFAIDLNRFYGRVGQWESFDEFLAFNRHAERLLWLMGLFPWDNGEETRIEVPLEIDGAALVRDVLDGTAEDVAIDDDQRALLEVAMREAEINPPQPFGVGNLWGTSPTSASAESSKSEV